MVPKVNTPRLPPSSNIVPVFIRLPDVLRLLSIGRSTLYVLRTSDPTFPQAIHLSQRVMVWDREEIMAWAEKRKECSRITLSGSPAGEQQRASA